MECVDFAASANGLHGNRVDQILLTFNQCRIIHREGWTQQTHLRGTRLQEQPMDAPLAGRLQHGADAAYGVVPASGFLELAEREIGFLLPRFEDGFPSALAELHRSEERRVGKEC